MLLLQKFKVKGYSTADRDYYTNYVIEQQALWCSVQNILITRTPKQNWLSHRWGLAPTRPHLSSVKWQADRGTEKVISTTPLLPQERSLKFPLFFYCALWTVSQCAAGLVPSRIFRYAKRNLSHFLVLLKMAQALSLHYIWPNSFWNLWHTDEHTHFCLYYRQDHQATNRI